MCFSRSCTPEVLGTVTDARSCVERIHWLQSDAGGRLAEPAACQRVASEFPAQCGSCSPGNTTNCKRKAPVLLLSDGCSYSTAIMSLMLQMLRAHCEPLVAPIFEPQICNQNRYCHESPTRTPAMAIVEALRAEVHAFAWQCQSVMLKGHCGGRSWQEYARALRELGSDQRSIMVYRPNFLDKIICEVRDCMGPGMPAAMAVERQSKDHVNKHVRPVNCSITRRGLPHAQQPMVWLDPQALIGNLRTQMHRASGVCINQTWPHKLVKRFRTDHLLAFETGPDDSAEFNKSIDTWAKMVDAVGVASDTARIQSLLVSRPMGRPLSEAQPQPHAAAIFNAAEVHKALLAAGLGYLWRAGD